MCVEEVANGEQPLPKERTGMGLELTRTLNFIELLSTPGQKRNLPLLGGIENIMLMNFKDFASFVIKMLISL